MVFNGEIYNFADLRRRLEAEGQTFQSSGDTAVMLRALGLHGPDAVAWLRGMFAFACWDPKQRRLLLARDPLGIKPLYLARSSDPGAGWSVAFASELRALLASGLLRHAAPRPAGRGQQRLERLRGGTRNGRKGRRSCSGRAGCSSSTAAVKEVRQEDFWRIPERPPAAEMDEARWPPSWKRG